jgi:hypothetical protein
MPCFDVCIYISSHTCTVQLFHVLSFNYNNCFLFQLCTSSDLAGNADKILDVLIQYLVLEHIDYAVELGLQGKKRLNDLTLWSKYHMVYWTQGQLYRGSKYHVTPVM